MTTTSLFHALQAMVRRRLAGPDLNRYLSALSDAEPVFASIQTASVDVEAVKSAYRGILEQSDMARATRYNRIFRLNAVIDAAIEEGIVVPAQRFSDFPDVAKPGDEVGIRLYNKFLKFQEYCLGRRISFNDVSGDVIEEYLTYLKDAFARSTAEAAYNDLARFWETAGFQQLRFQPFTGKGKNHYGLPVRSWPDGWRKPMDAFRAAAERAVTAPEYGRWKKALSPVGAREYEKVVGYFAGYMKLTGVVLQDTSLKDVLAKPANVIGFIHWHIMERCGGAERCYHASWLGMFARLDRFFSKRKAVQPAYIEAYEALEIELVREIIDTDTMSLHRLLDAAEDAGGEAIRTWKAGQKNLTAAIRY